jgi:methionine biosynthesis protein MetW
MVEKLRKKLARRPDLCKISELIPANVKILDLGCGDGILLKLLKTEKSVTGTGVEISQKKILDCAANGVPVVHTDLDRGLKIFSDNSFDFVILSQTLQALEKPDLVIEEMIRVGRKGIISFINIGYFKARFQIAFCGKMPVTKTLPAEWYKSENIHLSTIWDFKVMCKARGIKILEEIPLGHKSNFLAGLWPNLFAPTCVFVISKKDCRR